MPDPTPSAAHVAAAEAAWRVTNDRADPTECFCRLEVEKIAAILVRHFPSPPPVQEFAALAARAEDFRGEIAGPLYPKQDHEELGDWYFIHLEAMTSEGLHLKSDIAGQLARRDRECANLVAALGRERARADAIMDDCGRLAGEVRGLREAMEKLPKTADGVPIVPGMRLGRMYDYGGGKLGEPRETHPIVGFRVDDDGSVTELMWSRGWTTVVGSLLYSTLDAALRAADATPVEQT